MTTATLTFPILAQLASMKGAKFASFRYVNTKGEDATHVVILGADTRKLYEKDIETVNAMLPNLSGIELQAAQEIMSSLAASLVGGIGNNPAYTHGAEARGEGNETYVHIMEGVRVHRETGAIYVNGLSESKVIHTPGTYKEVKSRPLTLAKKAIDKTLRRGKIRQYALANITIARMNGETLELA